MKSEIVCDGIPFGEGPVWCEDETLVVTSVAAGALFRIWPETARVERFAETGGGAGLIDFASDHESGVKVRCGQDRGDNRRCRGFAMRATHRNAIFQAHQFGKHFGAAIAMA